MTVHVLPTDVEYVRTTSVFTEETVPQGLLSAHRVADHTWAVLTVVSGELGFVFDADQVERRLGQDETQVIPPRLIHHLVVDQPAAFTLAFHRRVRSGEPES